MFQPGTVVKVIPQVSLTTEPYGAHSHFGPNIYGRVVANSIVNGHQVVQVFANHPEGPCLWVIPIEDLRPAEHVSTVDPRVPHGARVVYPMCTECGEREAVKYTGGLCQQCYNGLRLAGIR